MQKKECTLKKYTAKGIKKRQKCNKKAWVYIMIILLSLSRIEKISASSIIAQYLFHGPICAIMGLKMIIVLGRNCFAEIFYLNFKCFFRKICMAVAQAQ